MADPLMRAYIQLRADDTGLRADTQSKVKAATAGVEGKAKISLDTTQADRDRAALQSRLSALGARATVIRAKLDADDKAGLARIAAFQVRLMALDKKVSSPKISVQGAARAEAQILAVDAAMSRMDNTAKAGRGGIAGLIGEITGFGAAGTAASSSSGLFARALAGIQLATGVLEPAMAGLIVVAAGTAAAFAAAGAGLGVFGVVAGSVLSQGKTAADAYAKAQDQLTKATSPAQRTAAIAAEKAALAGLDSAQLSVVHSIQQAQAAWKGFTQAATPGVAKVLADAVGLLPRAFALMQPFLGPVETALRNIIGQIKEAIAPGTQFSSIMGDLAKASGPLLQNALTAAGNILMGILGVVRAFLPEGVKLSGWLVDATAKFKEWGLTLQGHTGFQSLMTMFQTQTPVAMEILRNLGTTIINIGTAVAGLSTVSNSLTLLQVLRPLSGILAQLSADPALVNLALYALAFNSALGKLAPALTLVKGAVKAWTTEQRLLDVALNANVIGLVVIAVAALAIGMHEAWKRSAAFRDVMKTVASGFIEAGQIIVGGAKFILDAVLGLFGSIIDGAARAFGWVPKIGDKLKGAAAAFDSFKIGVDNAMQGAINKMQQWQDSLNTNVSTSRDATAKITADFTRQQTAAANARTAVGNYTTTLQTHSATSDAVRQARTNLINDLIKAGVNATTAKTDVNNYTTAVQTHSANSDAVRSARTRLISDIVSASNNAKTGKTDLDRFTTAVASHSSTSDAVRSARTRLISDLIAAGVDSRTAKDLVDKLGGSIRNLPASKKAQIVMQGSGTYSIAMTSSTNPYPGGISGRQAAGGLIRGPGTGTSDTAGLYALSNNEWVIRAASARRYGGAAMAAVNEGRAVIGYAAGGQAGVPVPVTGMASGGNIAMGNATPAYVNKMYADFQSRFTASMVAAMRNSLDKAKSQAQAALISSQVANVGAGVARWTGTVQQALRMLGLPLSLTAQVLRQIATESGGNPNAINNWDINAQRGDPSRGLLQTIGSTFSAYHVAGTSWNIYDPLANIAAAINYARHVYGPSLMSGGNGLGSGHGYDAGGWLPPGASLAVNRTGQPERVLPPGGGDDLSRRLDRLIAGIERLTEVCAAAPARTGQHVGAALSGGAAAAAFRSRYPAGAW